MLDGDGPFIRLAKWLALIVALLISAGTPAAYLYFGYEGKIGEITGEMNTEAQQVSRLINGNPEYWQFEGLRIGELIGFRGESSDKQLHRVFGSDGDVIAQRPSQAPAFFWPTLSRQKVLYDYGKAVGRIELVHSLKSLYQRTMIVGIISMLAGALVYWGLRVVPLRLLRRAWERIRFLASHDELTGLPNRVTFLDRLAQAFAGARRSYTPVTVYSLDLDHFKDVNDTLGHAAGDLLLQRAARRMQECLREGDTLARLGGDEFAIFQTGIEQPETAAALAERIISELSRPFDLNGHDVVIGASVGMSISTGDDPENPEQLLMNADLAMYSSKKNGRGTYHFFQEEMNAELKARKAIEVDLRKALRDGEFELHYQPQVDLSSQRIIGLEALLRWHHAERGDVPPAEVIPVAESTGLIRPLSEWVLRTACREALNWAPLRIAVNLSPSLFQQKGLVEMVERALKESGLPADRLELEITEEILMTDTERTLDLLGRLKALGVHIAMDDFGTGYSSLSYLRRFPFDKIKIDNAFIADLHQNGDAKAIVQAIISMGHALKMQVNAEGVETIEQANILMGEGCQEVQGYLYGRPMRKKDIATLLRSAGTLLPVASDDAKTLPLRA